MAPPLLLPVAGRESGLVVMALMRPQVAVLAAKTTHPRAATGLRESPCLHRKAGARARERREKCTPASPQPTRFDPVHNRPCSSPPKLRLLALVAPTLCAARLRLTER
eukprot:2002424-Prymnesium_polylepis.1